MNTQSPNNEKFVPGKFKLELARYKPDTPIFGFSIDVEGKTPSLCSTGVYKHDATIILDFTNTHKPLPGFFAPEEAEQYAKHLVVAGNNFNDMVEVLKEAKEIMTTYNLMKSKTGSSIENLLSKIEIEQAG